MSWLYGDGEGSILDRWSLIHFIAGMLIGANCKSWGVHGIWFWSVTIFLALGWELVEIGIERMRGHNPEGWLNRWVGDPILVTAGSVVGFWWVGGVLGYIF
jgi:hypothetical protein